MAWNGTEQKRPIPPGQVIINLKLIKYSRWKSSGWLVYNLGRLELTVITGQFGLLYRQVYRKVSKQGCKQASKQTSLEVSGHGSKF